MLTYTDLCDVWMSPCKNIFTVSFVIANKTCHFQGIKQNPLGLGFSKLVSFKFIHPYIFLLFPIGQMLNFAAP